VALGCFPQAVLQWHAIFVLTSRGADPPTTIYAAAILNMCTLIHSMSEVWTSYTKRYLVAFSPDPWVIAFVLQYTAGVVLKVLVMALVSWPLKRFTLLLLVPGFLARLVVAKLHLSVETNAQALSRAFLRLVLSDFYMVEDPINIGAAITIQTVETISFILISATWVNKEDPDLFSMIICVVAVICVAYSLEKILVGLFAARYKRKPGREVQGLENFWHEEGSEPILNCTGGHGLVGLKGDGKYICNGCKEKPKTCRLYGCAECGSWAYCQQCATGCYVVPKNKCSCFC